MRLSGSITKLAAALLKAQQQMGDAVKGSKNPFFKSSYADLNSIREVVTPALNANGITLLQPTRSGDGSYPAVVETVLLHESGEYISCETAIVVGKQNDPQAAGSGISYARRYGLQSLLNIGTVDDDGESAMNRSGTQYTIRPKVTHESVTAIAQAVVARKLISKESLLKELNTDTVSEGIKLLSTTALTELNTRLEKLLNGTK